MGAVDCLATLNIIQIFEERVAPFLQVRSLVTVVDVDVDVVPSLTCLTRRTGTTIPVECYSVRTTDPAIKIHQEQLF